ncbi:MAG TPA: M36 family metallopeptidase [Saprospiraceae bacterium]|nr:M36 family metallopeptidase [Saprospiraceae bacterium]
MKNHIVNLLTITVLCTGVSVNAQRQSNLDLAMRFMESQEKAWGLVSSDLSDVLVSDRYQDEHNGVEHLYFQQTYKGIPIFNAVTSVHIDRQGHIYDSPSRFIGDVSTKINGTKPRLSELQALKQLLTHYQVENALLPSNISRSGSHSFFEKTNFTHSDIPVKLCYVLNKENKLRLAWDLSLELVGRNDFWSARVDAMTGELIGEQNLTIKCAFGDRAAPHQCRETSHHAAFHTFKESKKMESAAPVTNGAAVYNVIPLPTESPLHGPRQLVSNPADPIASKFGWHTTKTDGSPEYTGTRGNNVYAYLDRNADNAADLEIADGGAALNFDFPFDRTKEPVDYAKAAMTNLFYMCNMMHDITYGFGFTEAAGNFQTNTYGKGGLTDRVNAEAQDGSGVNNANFSTPVDGSNGRMQMYQWTNSLSEVNVDAPSRISGNISATRGAFGSAPSTTPITAQAVWSDDGSSDPKLGCKNSQKGSKVAGKIVLIDRGICEFGSKAFYAQNAGAVAVIICGFDDQNVSMSGGADGGKVTIPSYYITASTCAKLKSAVDSGTCVITIVAPMNNNSGPDSLDGDFDNGIIAHEYGHGISNRLTGGPANANCLGNIENMGEGWSDFFALITTAKQGDKGTDVRGIGNYALAAPLDGVGIRRRPYTTNININEFTYRNMGTETHDIGEVWAAMLWDLYWAMADKYGYDPSFSNKNAGNNKAIQLVMDGMKLQPCGPGFVDGRNAILQADRMNYNGENQCLIWDVFARRGVGFNANQGNTNTAGDETEDFESFPTCANTTSIKKTATQLVKAGSEITYNINVRNLRAQKINNVKVTDHIPSGCTYVSGSASIAPASTSATEVIWDLGTMDSVQTKIITYKVKTDPAKFSNTLWIDNLESPTTEDNYVVEVSKGNIYWFLNPDIGVGDSHAYQVPADNAAASDAQLQNLNPIPVPDQDVAFLFFHKYNTENNIDGGFIQLSGDGGQTFSLVDPASFDINPYNGNIDYSAIAIPKNKGYTGRESNFVPSVLSLDNYRNKKLVFRFRFGNDAANIPANGEYVGWTVDNFELINPVYYNSEACVTTSLGESICVPAPGKGTLVDSKKIVSTSNPQQQQPVTILPNPANGQFTVFIPASQKVEEIRLLTTEGQLLSNMKVQDGQRRIVFTTENLPKGVILIQAISAGKTSTAKLILQ